MKIESIIFDMDGTLVDSLMIWDVLWSKFGERFLGDAGFRPRPEVDKAVRTLTLKDAMCHVHEVEKIGKNGEELLDAANEIMIDFYSNTVELKSGVKEFLDWADKCGIKMCIASATDKKLVEIAVSHTGIGKYISKLFSCADIGKGKEHPDVYKIAHEYLGTDIDKTWVFEDSAAALCTARSIGMPTVGIYDKFNFGHDVVAENSTIHIGDGETLKKVIEILS